MPGAPARGGRLVGLLTDRGSAAAELVLLIPALLLVLYLIVYSERGPESRMRLDDAAHQAARAASQARTPAAAIADAESTATAALARAGISCRTFTVEMVGSLQPGSTVTVDIACSVGLEDLSMLPLPGTTVLEADFAAVVDRYRAAATASAGEGSRTP
ncbi:TadE/TadG family type IV pilus assembly protein [Streptomyces sp. NPDC127098]|uniref:TadE/TadG family type IV pilus assembly protein n=1 Tax=Streptomyces sp. NPDC127098 TaxID=3347137 RepID=UPI0036618F1D